MFEINQKYPLLFTKSNGKYQELHSPNDLKTMTNIQLANAEDIGLLMNELKSFQKTFQKVSKLDVSLALKHIAKRILEEKDNFAHLIAIEGGKPLKDALIEVERAALTFTLCAEEATRIHGEMIPMERSSAALGKIAFTMKEPIGPVLAISAFNHPLNLLAHQVGCALASGCVVVLKPSPGTPLNAYQLKKLFLETNLPPEVLTIAPCDVAEIEQMVANKAFGYVSFIGSAKVGWSLRSKLAAGTRLALEHGGIAPAIVCADADIERAVKSLIKGAFYHAGQVCISTQRIFVHQSIREVFVNRFLEETKKLKTQSATLADTDVGPLIRPSEVVRIKSWIEEAVHLGAKLLIGNSTEGSHQQFLHPTVLFNVSEKSKLMNEEVFGPVVCINEFENLDILMDSLSETELVFESSIFTNDMNIFMKAIKALPAMSLVINEHTAFRVDWMPFGGHKASGLGMGGVKYSIEEMTRTKQIIIST